MTRPPRLAALAMLSLLVGCSPATGAAPTSASAPSAAPSTAAATPPPLATVPGPAPTVVPTSAPDPLPDALLGAWYMAAPAFMWFSRAGDPVCVNEVRTNLDCMSYQLVGKPMANGVATMQGRVLTIEWVHGYCAGDSTRFGTGIVGNVLHLFDQPDDCGGGDFTLARAGTGSAPTAPPLPTG